MMTSSRPYLIRAIYDWILDNKLTPYILVEANSPEVQVPPSYIDEEGKIILNLAPLAVTGFAMGNEAIEFKASFGGRLHHLYVPIPAIIAIYAFENGRGLVLGEEEPIGGISGADFSEQPESHPDHDDDVPPPTTPPKKGKPNLTIVK